MQEFVHHTQRMTAGDPMSEETTVGATITAAHAEKVLGFIERAKEVTVVTWARIAQSVER